MERPKIIAPYALLGAALVGSFALLLALGAKVTFFQDTWAFLLERRGTSAADFLRPHNDHISVIPVTIQKLEVAWFGLSSAAPERVLLTAMLTATAFLLFVYVRRRAGDWPALFAATILLFLGPAWEVLLWPFEISVVGSALTGLAMLLALDRGDRRGDIAACLLLIVSVGFSSLGISFLVGAAADVLMRRRDPGLSRLYVPAVPAVLYAAWYLAYGQDASSALSLHNAIAAPVFVLESLAGSLAAISGFRAIAGDIETIDRGLLLLVPLSIVIAIGGYLLLRDRSSARLLLARASEAGLWPAAAAATASWGLLALNDMPGRAALASRYMYVGGLFVLLIAANLLRGVRIGRRAIVVGGICTLVAAALNLKPLVEGRNRLTDESVLTRADLAAIEIARRTVSPDFSLGPDFSGTVSLINVSAGPYLAEIEEHGSPAYSQAELATAPELGRRQADVVLAEGLPVTVEAEPGGTVRDGSRCRWDAAGPEPGEFRLGAGETRVAISPGPPATLALRRFAVGEYPVDQDPVPGGSIAQLRIPADESSRPWILRVDADQRVSVCR